MICSFPINTYCGKAKPQSIRLFNAFLITFSISSFVISAIPCFFSPVAASEDFAH